MSQPLYRQIFKDAWLITWRYRFLWILGIFVAILGNGGVYEIFFRGWRQITDQGTIAGLTAGGLLSIGDLVRMFFSLPPARAGGAQAGQFFLFSGSSLAGLAIILAGLVIIFLVVTSQGAIIKCIQKITKKKTIALKEEFIAGLKYFWPLLGVNVAVNAAVWLLLSSLSLVALLTLISGAFSLGNALLFVIIFIITISLALIISFIAIYASAYVVIKDRPFIKSLSLGWLLFLKNWLVSIEMALIMLAVNILAGGFLVLASFLVALPFLLLITISYYVASQFAFWLFAILGILAILGLIILTGSLLSTLQYSAWVLLFLRFGEKDSISKIVRLGGELPRYLNTLKNKQKTLSAIPPTLKATVKRNKSLESKKK